MKKPITALLACTLFSLAGCTGAEGPPGPRGAAGAPGPKGEQGEPGKDADSIDGSRLAARYIVGDDGSRQPLGDWLDVETGQACSFGKAPDKSLRCLPDFAPFYVGFLDDECTKMTVIAQSQGGEEPPPVYGRPESGGPYVFKAGQVKIATPEMFYDIGASGCVVAATGPVGFSFYAAEDVPLDFFVSGEVIAE